MDFFIVTMCYTLLKYMCDDDVKEVTMWSDP